MSFRAAMSVIVPAAFAIYALAIHAEEVKTTEAPATEQAAKPTPKPGGAPHVKPFDGATGAQAGGGKKRWDMVENKGGVQQQDASAPDKGGWDQKKGQGGIANPQTEPDEAMLLPAVQKVSESAARSR